MNHSNVIYYHKSEYSITSYKKDNAFHILVWKQRENWREAEKNGLYS